MKLIGVFVTVFAFLTQGFSQEGLYVKYEAKIDVTEEAGADGDMMAMMMQGTTMELAFNSDWTYLKTQMGTMMTMEMQLNQPEDSMLMVMSGLMGDMAFAGSASELGDEEEEEVDVDIELVDEEKTILGYKCKKAEIKDEDGNIGVYWYTEEFKQPDGMTQMPNQVPGFCLEIETFVQEGIKVTYTAVEANENANLLEYSVVVPEGVEIQSLEEMQNMGY